MDALVRQGHDLADDLFGRTHERVGAVVQVLRAERFDRLGAEAPAYELDGLPGRVHLDVHLDLPRGNVAGMVGCDVDGLQMPGFRVGPQPTPDISDVANYAGAT